MVDGDAKPKLHVVGSHPLHTPLTSPQALLEHARHYYSTISDPNWVLSPEAISSTLQHLAIEYHHFPAEQRLNLLTLVCKRLSIEPERFDFLMRAETVADFERALEWKPVQLQLSPDERVYPSATGWMGDYMSYACGGEANITFHFWAGLCVLAAAAGRNFYVQQGGHTGRELYPNLYVILEGPSGSGKGTSIFRGLDMVERLNQRLSDDKSRPTPPVIHTFPSKISLEDLVKLLHGVRRTCKPFQVMGPTGEDAYESTGLIVCEEATTMLGKDVVGSERLLGGLTALYDGRLDEGTIKRGEFYLSNVSLTCLLGSTMDWLKATLTEQIFRGGFMGARCLLISRKKTGRKFYREPISDPVLRDALITRLTEIALSPKTRLKLTPEADRWMEQWYLTIPEFEETDSRLASFRERLDIFLLKLASLLSLSAGTEPWIELPAMEFAAKILEEEAKFMVRALRLVSSRTAIDDMEFIEQVLFDCGGRIRQTDLINKCRYKLGTRKYILELLGTLQMAGRIKSQFTKSKGGPAVLWWLLCPKSDTHVSTLTQEGVAEMNELAHVLDEQRRRLESEEEARRDHERRLEELREAARDVRRMPPGVITTGRGGKGSDDPFGEI